MKYFRTLVAVFLAALAIACQKEPVLELSGSSHLSFTRSQGYQTISFSTNRDWIISSTESWCRVSPASGSASRDLLSAQITCDANESYDARTCVITIKADELMVTIQVTQDQKNAISVEDGSLVADGRAQELTVAAMANVDVNVRIPAGVSWITPGLSGKGLVRKDVAIQLQRNDSDDFREATIYLEKDDVSVPVTVLQGPYHPVLEYYSPGACQLKGADYIYRPGLDQYSEGIRNNARYFRLLDPEHLLMVSFTGIPLQEPSLFEEFALGVKVTTEEKGIIYNYTIPSRVIGVSDSYLWLKSVDGEESFILKK